MKSIISLSIAALLASTSFAYAQKEPNGGSGKSEGGAAAQSAPAQPSGGEKAAAPMKEPGSAGREDGAMPAKDSGKSAKGEPSGQKKDSGSAARDEGEKADKNSRDAAKAKDDDKSGGKDSKAAERKGDDKAAESKGDARGDKAERKSETKPDMKSDSKADSKADATGKNPDGANKAEGSKPDTSGSKKDMSKVVTPEQRTKVQTGFTKHKVEPLRDVDFSLSVGVSVPRRVRFYPIPEDIVIIVPEYRSYRYFIVNDRVIIVDPDSFEIVDIVILA